MFNRKPKEKTKIEEAIDALLSEMVSFGAESDEYAQCLKQLGKLHKIQTCERPERVSLDTLAIVGGNILGILVIVIYEQKHVMTSKALGFIKPVSR